MPPTRCFAVSFVFLVVPAATLQAEIDFAKTIQPIFRERCYDCHGAETREAGLRLDQKDDALAGSDSGEVIKPGDPDDSLLIQLISGDDADRLMPPDGDNLTADEIEAIRKWIEEGAHWPDGVDPEAEQNAHWAYQPLTFRIPEVAGEEELSPIDRFILAQLSKQQIEPSPLADRVTLLRRLAYDLWGLPPSPEEADQFLNDDSPDAYEKLVDRMLASPHFGERWGRHWLDMARYADSDGYEKDRPRYNAWKYRDWVINAINADMPIDQFTVEQLAGDLLPEPTDEQLLATAFHRQTLTNTEGGTDQEEFRVAAVFDRVETVGTVWMGLTIGCARCHSHKYDDISQREYYQLFAFFNNGDEANHKMPSSPEAFQEYRKKKAVYDARLQELQAPLVTRRTQLDPEFADWQAELQAAFDTAQAAKQLIELELSEYKSLGGAGLQMLDDGSILSDGQGSVQDVYELRFRANSESSIELAGIRLDVLTHETLPKKGPGISSGGNFVLSEITLDAVSNTGESTRRAFESATSDFNQKGYEVQHAIDGKEETKGWAISPQMGKPHHATFLLSEPLSAERLQTSELLVRLSQQYGNSLHTLGRFKLSWLTPEQVQLESLSKEVKDVLAIAPDQRDQKQLQTLKEKFYSEDAEYRSLQAAVTAHQKTAPFQPLMDVPVIRPRTKSPRETHVLKRGDFLQPLGTVQPETLSVLPEFAVDSEGVPTRLDFAQWLVNGENPLPPRVMANQIWAHLFGAGLVNTLNDFGVRGEPPTHPQLLDWLAAHLVESNWSRKTFIKTIVMSQAYRRSSRHRPDLTDVDPNNRQLARQNRFRVEAEIIRDLNLAASGLLERRIGGPSVFPPLPPGIAELSYANNFKWGNSDWNSRPDRPHGVAPKDDIYRRGMYTFFKRTAAHPNLVTFDCPDSNTTCVDRGTSNTPLQALQTLNNSVFLEAARTLASSVISQTQDREQRLDHLFRRCLTRRPTMKEQQILSELLEDAHSRFADNSAAAIALTGEDESTKAAQLAAWTVVARTVMNLDEFITRE